MSGVWRERFGVDVQSSGVRQRRPRHGCSSGSCVNAVAAALWLAKVS